MASNSSVSLSAAGWDHTVDVLVVGSGAGGMVTALTAHDAGASTLIVEKDVGYGGSSARSGGGMWIPTNHMMKAEGREDNSEDALTYLKAVIGEGVESEERLKAYVKYAPEMFKYLCDNTRLQPQTVPLYPDYHPSKPGWRKGRIVEPKIFDARPLGDELLNLHKPPTEGIMERYHITILEANDLLQRRPGWIKILLTRMIKYWLDIPWRFKSKRSRDLGFGLALIASLRHSLMDRNIPLWLNSPARELINENGRVVGVVVERENGLKVRVRANKGVVMASGGFEGSTLLREKYLPNPTNAKWACGSPANTGDSIAMGQAVGAKLDFMNYVCWMPVDLQPGIPGGRGKIVERSVPGTMIVNKRGERYMNEALPYINAVEAMYANDKPEGTTVPSFMIFDATYRATKPFGPVLPGTPDAMIPKGYLEIGKTLEELAQKLGIDPAGLKASAAKMTEYACTGVDLDFHRGENEYDCYFGDPNTKPNICLGAIEKGPFYGTRIYPGDLGTTGGLKTDVHARVLNEQMEVIPGLYATGNCSAGAIAGTYPGPGCTLGPTMTYGYIAARHLTQKN